MECMWNGDLWSSTSHDIKSLKVPTSPSRGKENTLNNNGSNTDILISLAKNGDYKRLSFLVNHEKKLDLNGADSKGRTALMVAAARNHISIIKCLLEKGASASKQSTVGQTALMMAAGRGVEASHLSSHILSPLHSSPLPSPLLSPTQSVTESYLILFV